MLTSLADTNEALDGRVESAPPSPRFLWVQGWNPWADPLWQRILTEVGGRNLYGEPMLRIVNGSSRLELMGGVWENTEEEDAGLPSLREQWDQRYPWFEEFWLVEEWIPTRISREAWEARERKTEDGVTYLEHPIYPSRGRYIYFSHFRRQTIVPIEAAPEAGSGVHVEYPARFRGLYASVHTPERPTPGGLRLLASRWRRLRAKTAPAELEEMAAEHDKRMAENARVERERRLLREKDARKAKRDIWENEVGGLTGFTPRVSLAGLDVPVTS